MKRTVITISTLVLISALNIYAQATGGGTSGRTSGQTGGSSGQTSPSQTPVAPGLNSRDQLPRVNNPDQLPPGLPNGTTAFGTVTNQFGGTNQFAGTNSFSTITNSFGVITNQYLGGTNVTPTGGTNSYLYNTNRFPSP